MGGEHIAYPAFCRTGSDGTPIIIRLYVSTHIPPLKEHFEKVPLGARCG